jgi:hypothetical protein
MPDLNAYDLAWAMMTVRWTSRASWITTEIDNLTLKELREKLS